MIPSLPVSCFPESKKQHTRCNPEQPIPQPSRGTSLVKSEFTTDQVRDSTAGLWSISDSPRANVLPGKNLQGAHHALGRRSGVMNCAPSVGLMNSVTNNTPQMSGQERCLTPGGMLPSVTKLRLADI